MPSKICWLTCKWFYTYIFPTKLMWFFCHLRPSVWAPHHQKLLLWLFWKTVADALSFGAGFLLNKYFQLGWRDFFHPYFDSPVQTHHRRPCRSIFWKSVKTYLIFLGQIFPSRLDPSDSQTLKVQHEDRWVFERSSDGRVVRASTSGSLPFLGRTQRDPIFNFFIA